MPIMEIVNKRGERIGLPQLGMIYKGSPKRVVKNDQGREVEIMGVDLDYYRVEFMLAQIEKPNEEERVQLQFFQERFQAVYGDQPRRFSDVLLCGGNTPDTAFTSWMEQYKGKNLEIRCDGESQVKWWNTQSLRMDKTPRPCALLVNGKCECKPVGRLPVVLMNFSLLTGIVGYFMLTTHSISDIGKVDKALHWHYERVGDKLDKIAFVLSRTPTPLPFVTKKGERSSKIHWLITLHSDARFVQDHLLAAPDNAGSLNSQMVRATEALAQSDQASLPAPVDPPIAIRLDLGKPAVRSVFLKMLKAKYDKKGEDVLEKLKEDSYIGLEWFETCERLGIELEPPDDLGN